MYVDRDEGRDLHKWVLPRTTSSTRRRPRFPDGACQSYLPLHLGLPATVSI